MLRSYPDVDAYFVSAFEYEQQGQQQENIQ